MKKTLKIIYICIFLFVISFPTLFMGVYIEETKADYKTYIKETPMQIEEIYEDQELSDIIPNVKTYYNQHVAKRQDVIDFWASMLYSIDVSMNKSITIGKAGMLFYSGTIRELRGSIQRKDNLVNRDLNTIQKLSNSLEEKGIDFLFVIAPNKATVYKEYLPDWYTEGESESYREQFNRLYNEGEYAFDFLDTTDVLIDAKEEHGSILYPNTDAHWSPLGAYIAYNEIVRTINEEYEIVEIKEYRINEHQAASQMRMIGRRYDLIMEPVADIYFKDKGSADLSYLDGNTNWKRYGELTNDEAFQDLNVLIIRDSFTGRLTPTLEQTFTKVGIVHYQTVLIGDKHGQSLDELIEVNNPDIVIFQIVERALDELEDIDRSVFEQ